MQEEILDETGINSQPNVVTRMGEPNSSRAIMAMIVIGLMTLVQIPIAYYYYQMQNVSYDAYYDFYAEQSEPEQMIEMFDFALIGFNILAVIFFLMWFSRAYKNMDARFKAIGSTGWAVGAWFIPVYCWIKPYSLAKEMWIKNTSGLAQMKNETAPESNFAIPGFWWVLWVISSLLNNIATQNELRGQMFFDGNSATKFMFSITILSIPSGIFAVLFIYKLNQTEKEIYTLERSEGSKSNLEYSDSHE